MNLVIDRYGKRILAVCCVVLIVLLQVVFVMPASAETTAGEELEVRVQYEGEPGGKIRTAAVFTDGELEALGAQNRMFVNITRVGTVMRSATRGVELERIIEAAGIELSSVESFTFRTTDGYTMTFYGEDYLGVAGWYYPNLSDLSYRVDSEDGDGALQMTAGALDDAVSVPGAVLSLKSYSSKSPSKEVSYEKMSKATSYRFFSGQTDLSYLRYEDEDGNEAFYPSTENDITAWDSVKYIYGVDVVLKGTPPLEGISLEVIGDAEKIGSQVRIEVTFEGDTLGIFNNSDVTWTSSDSSIATVDETGIVTIKKEGEVTITASAGGKTASVTLGTPAGGEDDADKQNDADKVKATTKATKATTTATKPASTKPTKTKENKKQDTKKDKKAKPEDDNKKMIVAREINIGKEIVPEPEEAESAASVKPDTQALEAVEEYDPKVVGGSAAAAVLACSGGAVFRIRRFRADMGTSIKGKH